MKTKIRSMEEMIENQILKWNLEKKVLKEAEKAIHPVISVSREPGSGGRIIAEHLAKQYDLDLFHRGVLQNMAENAKVSKQLLETLDEKGLSVLEDWIASLVDTRHLWPDQYLKHLMRVVLTVGKHGRAVIVGRGANFILAPAGRFRIRVIAPLEMRVRNVSRDHGVTTDVARRRIVKTESDRKAFVRKYFNEDIGDPVNYDMVVNTETLAIEKVVQAVGNSAGLKIC